MYCNKNKLSEQILEWQQSGEPSAELVETINDIAVGVCKRYYKPYDHHDDIISIYWLTLLRKYQECDTESNAFSWLTQHAIWTAMQFHRSMKTNETVSFGEAEENTMAEPTDDRRVYVDQPDTADTMRRRPSHWEITIDGITDTLVGWSKRKNISHSTIQYRMRSLRMTPLDALTTPPMRNGNLSEEIKSTGIQIQSYYDRRAAGMTHTEAITTPRFKPLGCSIDGVYRSVMQHCKHYDISYSSVYNTMRKKQMKPEAAIMYHIQRKELVASRNPD